MVYDYKREGALANLKKKKTYLVPLLSTFVVIATFATAFLMKIVFDYGYTQFGRIVQESINAAIDYSQNTFDTVIERQNIWLKDEEITQDIAQIINNYETNGTYTKELINNQLLKYQEDQIKAFMGSRSKISYEIVHGDKIIYSTINREGEKFNFIDMHNSLRYERYKKGIPNRLFLVSIENIKPQLYNLVILMPAVEESLESLIALTIRDIDLGRLLKIDRVHVFPGVVYFVNANNELFVKIGDNQGIVTINKEFEVPKKLSNALKSSVLSEKVQLISYKNVDGKSVIGIGSWVNILDIGILLEIPAHLVMGPWYIMAGFIVAVSVISMLIFVLISVFLDKKRLSAYDHNPLTHLPGNQIILSKIELALSMKGMIIVYCDLDNFKAYNDKYGFFAGDSVIIYSASVLKKSLESSKKVFLGHIGGDDFVVIGKKEEVVPLLEKFGNDFDEGIKEFYNDTDVKQGYILSKDRQGNEHKFPFVAMSMGGLELEEGCNIHPLKVAEMCAEVKKIAKKEPGSKLVLDRRRFN